MLLNRRSQRQATSCTECRRRRQKCISTKPGSCLNCSRRYPPVECVGRPSSRINTFDKTESVHGTLWSKPKSLGCGNPNNHPTSHLPSHFEGRMNAQEDNVNGDQDSYTVQRDNYKLVGTATNFPTTEEPKSFGGIVTEVNCTNVIAVAKSRQNAELLYVFQQAVAPFMFALSHENHNTPIAFKDEVLPWIMQSPLMPHIAIFTASGYRAHTSGCEMVNHTQTMTMKGMLLHRINRFLEEDFEKIHEQVIQSILHLILMEWYSYDLISLWAHMNGLREMIRLRGSVSDLQSPLLRQLLILCFEQDLYIRYGDQRTEILISGSYPESYNSPLVDSITDFKEAHEQLDLSYATASILDDVRSITLSIQAVPTTDDDGVFTSTQANEAIQTHASQIYEQVLSLTDYHHPPLSSSQIISSIIQMTALAYTSCISHGCCFNDAYSISTRGKLYKLINVISLDTWKKIPGIFLWVLLVACPGSRFHAPFLLRSHVSAAGLYISLTNFDLAVGCLRSFWRLQMWIKGWRERGVEI